LLTLQQLQAIELLSEGKRSQQSIADEVGVTRRTVVRWLANPEFQAALAGVGSNQFVVNQAVVNPEIIQPQQSPVSIRQKLNSLAVTVVEQVEAILTNPESRTADKLKAAQILGKWCGLDAYIEASGFAMELTQLGMLDEKRVDRIIEASERYEHEVREVLAPVTGEK
jgi:predicted transcriptional regulator